MLLQIFLLNSFLISLICGFGALITIIRGKSCSNIQFTFGPKLFLFISCFGTIIHELSHFICCLFFRHKVTKLCLFSPKAWKTTGTLGHVEHAYNPKSLYQQAGNFIIGIAPVIGGSLVSFLIMKLTFYKFQSIFPENASFSMKSLSLAFKNIWLFFINIFHINNLINPFFWVGLFLIISIFLHIALSKPDFIGAAKGIVFFLLIIPLIACICNFGGITFDVFLEFQLKITFYFLVILIFGLFMSLAIWIVSTLGVGIKKNLMKNKGGKTC